MNAISEAAVEHIAGRIALRLEQQERDIHQELERFALNLHCDAEELTGRVSQCLQGPWARPSAKMQDLRGIAALPSPVVQPEVAVDGGAHNGEAPRASRRTPAMRKAASIAKRRWWAKYNKAERSEVSKIQRTGKSLPKRLRRQ